MTKKILTLLCVLTGLNVFGQNIKTGVLVVGSTPAAMAAAIQSAKSGVKTVLIDAGKFDAITFSASDQALRTGIYADFTKRVDSLQKSPFKDDQTLTPAFTARVFKVWTDTLKNLTVLPGVTVKKIERWGRGWEVDLTNGREIKAEAMVDGTPDYSLSKMVPPFNKGAGFSPVSKPASDKSYRTSVAVSIKGNSFKVVPIADLLVPDVENLVLAGTANGERNLRTGQAAGAIAAYCAWFDTTTKKMKIRDIQTELISYNSRIIKYDDVSDLDSTIVSIQHIGVTGILKGKEENGKFLFKPAETINTEELRQPLREYYSRSHIWFLDNKEEKLTVASAIGLIKFLASRGEELSVEIQKGWRTALKLKGDYDLKRPISRAEFSVLLDKYLQPYTVVIDMEGNVNR